jgi:hypothetical protein
MSQPANQIDATIAAEVSGQVAVGHHILQIGSIHGGSVIVNTGDVQAAYTERNRPLRKLPRPFANLIGRKPELEQAQIALEAGQSVEFGDRGCGKSVLMRCIAHQLTTSDAFPDGILHFAASPQPLADRLQLLFSALYDSRPDFKPTEAQTRSLLEDKRALVIFDDRELKATDRKALLEILPHCTFVSASFERDAWDEERALAVRGLPTDDAVVLMARALERPILQEELDAARTICGRLEGHLRVAFAPTRPGRYASVLPVSTYRSSGRTAIRTISPFPKHCSASNASTSHAGRRGPRASRAHRIAARCRLPHEFASTRGAKRIAKRGSSAGDPRVPLRPELEHESRAPISHTMMRSHF